MEQKKALKSIEANPGNVTNYTAGKREMLLAKASIGCLLIFLGGV